MDGSAMGAQPDAAVIRQHLEILFGRARTDYPQGLVEIAWSHPLTGAVNSGNTFPITDAGLDAAAALAADKNRQNGVNLYVSANPRKPGTKPYGRASAADIEWADHHFAEIDNPEGAQRLLTAAMPPTWEVTTGTVPNRRVHPYWRLESPTRNLNAWAAQQKALAAAFNGDEMSNADRVMRLAGTVNYPSPKKIERGYVIERTVLRNGGCPVSDGDLLRAYPWVANGARVDIATGEITEKPIFGTGVNPEALVAAIRAGDGRHDSALRLIAHLVGAGHRDWYIREFLDAIMPADAGTRHQIDEMIASARRKWSKPDEEPAAELGGFDLTEDGIALAFAAKFKDQLRYCHHTGSWFEWTGMHWRREETKLAFSWARQTCRQFNKEGRPNNTLAKAATAGAVERFAEADRAFAVTSAVWDTDTMLLGTPGGTVDLRTGTIGPAAQTDMITKLTGANPSETSDCPIWLRFLDEATGGDKELIRFLQQWAGYCLTGDVREHALLFVYGPGGNGKSVWLNTMSGILADYARTAAMDTFTEAKGDRHPTDIAMLRGSRMVCASETEEGRGWAEAKIKSLTGGDPVSARFMRQDFFEFKPQFKLTVVGNHKPALRNIDDAVRRRFNVVPFTQRPAHPDPFLEAKIRTEWPAILRWMIEGCLDWQANGLTRLASVLAATGEYFAEQDTFSQWLEECCEIGRSKADTSARLFKSWTDYALANGERPGERKRFAEMLAQRGFTLVKNTRGAYGHRGYDGVGLKPVDTSSQWQNEF